ncbi:hypothetical protein Tco_1352746 [Tanacetum coccineum]
MGIMQRLSSSTQNTVQGISCLSTKGVMLRIFWIKVATRTSRLYRCDLCYRREYTREPGYTVKRSYHKSSSGIESENNNALSKSVNETQLQQPNSLSTRGQQDEQPVNDQVPFAEVQLTAQHNVLANEQQHTEQSEPIYDTYLLEKGDSNTTSDSTNMCHRGGEIDQDAELYQAKKVNSRAKVQSPKIRNNNPVEPKNHTHKPGRRNGIGQRFSLNKSSAVHEKPHTPRSYLRYICQSFKGKTRSLVTKKTDISYVRSSRNSNLMNMLQMTFGQNSSSLFKPRSSSNDVWTKQFKPRSSSNDVWTKQFKPRSSSNVVWTKQFKPRSSSKDVWTKQFRPRKSISLTEAEEEAVAREDHATHSKNCVLDQTLEPVQDT